MNKARSDRFAIYSVKSEGWIHVELPFRDDGLMGETLTAAIAFCENDLKAPWYKYLRQFWFNDPAEAIMFKLVFG